MTRHDQLRQLFIDHGCGSSSCMVGLRTGACVNGRCQCVPTPHMTADEAAQSRRAMAAMSRLLREWAEEDDHE
jgi:hypothetical protein